MGPHRHSSGRSQLQAMFPGSFLLEISKTEPEKSQTQAPERQQFRLRNHEVHLIEEHRNMCARLAQVHAKVMLLQGDISRRSGGVQVAGTSEF